MHKSLKITSLKDDTNDYQYWSTKSFVERLNAIELLRTHYYKLNSNAESRFQRVCRIINNKKS